ncbi:hypothetical protein [Microbacterium dauci]|uniref:PsbP C-terminal domain-containing protein n=1 Tax=Microbacterium dauci TaxID=3048008 RepID=A0ABT6ZE02_9MICO|nr:hypothetical protein [Microbacterium sp. LX3-4]MDJ1114379.1 hypothetical protein [Microbacterium sp. LX3-4]
MRRSVRSRAAAVLLAFSAGLALAGCSAPAGTDADESPAPAATSPAAVAPAIGPDVTAEAYTFQVPEGWGFPEEAPEGYDASMFAVDLADIEDGFSDNVNVITSPAGEITPEQVESAGVAELEAAQATDVTVLDRVDAAGAESAHLTAGFTSEGVEYTIDQYYLTSAGQTHIVTFSFSPGIDQAERDALAASVLATWTWN